MPKKIISNLFVHKASACVWEYEGLCANPFWVKGLRVCARKFLCDADAETHWGTQNSLDTIIFGRKPFVLREIIRNRIFLGNFLCTKPIHTCFETQKLSYYGKIPVHPPGLFYAQQLWNRNRLKPPLTMSFFTQRVLVPFSFFKNKNYIWWILKLFCFNLLFFF